MGILLETINRIKCKTNPVGYAKSLGVKLGNNVRFYGCKPNMFSTEPWLITIGNNVYIASDVQFLTHDAGTLITQKEVPGFVITGNITIGNDVCIGLGSTILPGVTIGNRCIIGTRSVVTKDIPNNSVVAGIPAKVLCSVDDYVDKIKGIINGNNPRYYADLDYMHSLKNKDYIANLPTK